MMTSLPPPKSSTIGQSVLIVVGRMMLSSSIMIWFLWQWDDDGIATIDEISTYLAMAFLLVTTSLRTRQWLSGGTHSSVRKLLSAVVLVVVG
jgi:hypothetical protein